MGWVQTRAGSPRRWECVFPSGVRLVAVEERGGFRSWVSVAAGLQVSSSMERLHETAGEAMLAAEGLLGTLSEKGWLR